MAPFRWTGATSLINQNDNNRNKMIFQHILKDVFQQHQPRLLPSPSPLIEIKRRFEWTFVAQQRHLPIGTTIFPATFKANKTTSIPTLIKLSLSSSSSSHGHRLLLKSPPPSSNQPFGPLTMISSPTHSHDDFFDCLNDGFSLFDDDDEYFFGVNVLCLKFCAGRLTLIMSRKDIRTSWINLKSCIVVVSFGECCDEDGGFTMNVMDVKEDWIGIHHRNRHHLLSLPSLLSPSSSAMLTHGIRKRKTSIPELVSWRKRGCGDTDDSIFIGQNQFHSDPYPIVDFTPSHHVEADSFVLSPSISSTSTSSSWTSCTFLSPPGSPFLNPTTTIPLYDNDGQMDESEDQYEPLADASLVALIQETLQYIHSSPSHHSYSTELESLVPKMGNFLSYSL